MTITFNADGRNGDRPAMRRTPVLAAAIRTATAIAAEMNATSAGRMLTTPPRPDPPAFKGVMQRRWDIVGIRPERFVLAAIKRAIRRPGHAWPNSGINR